MNKDWLQIFIKYSEATKQFSTQTRKQMDQGRYRNDIHVQGMIDRIIDSVKTDDILHLGFLRPIDVTLKKDKETGRVDDSDPRSHKSSRINIPSQRYGLLMVESSSTGMIEEYPIVEIQPYQTYQQLKQQNQDNMLTLIKSTAGLEVAICITLQQQTKSQLKKTLAGVKQNIANLVACHQIEPDRIAVFLIVDGIREVPHSIVDFYEQCQRASSIDLGPNVTPALSLEQLQRLYSGSVSQSILQQQLSSNTKFTLDAQQYQKRCLLRLEQVKAKYDEACFLLKQIKQLKMRRQNIDDLPERIRHVFDQNARMQYALDHGIEHGDMRLVSQEAVIQYFRKELDYGHDIVMKSIVEAENGCLKYISSKEELAHLAFFRHQIPYDQDILSSREKEDLDNTSRPLEEKKGSERKEKTVMNLFFCTKYQSAGKLDSHNWFFNGFCKELNTKYAFLLEAGVKPDSQALVKMYHYLTTHHNVGGVTGYINIKEEATDPQVESEIDEGTGFISKKLVTLFDIQKAQQVSYHFSNLLQNTFSSAFGMLDSLPTCFSAFNLTLLGQDKEDGLDIQNPVEYYLKALNQDIGRKKIITTEMGLKGAFLRTLLPEFVHSKCIELDPLESETLLYQANFEQSEATVMGWGISRKGLETAFLPDAYAQLSPSQSLPQLLSSRKQSVNSQTVSLGQKSKQNSLNFGPLSTLFTLYLTLKASLLYFSPCLFLFSIHISTDSFRQDILIHLFSDFISDFYEDKSYTLVVYTINFIYVLLMVSMIYFSLHLDSNDIRFRPYVYGICTFLGILAFVVVAVFAVDIGRGLTQGTQFLTSNEIVDSYEIGGTAIDILRYILLVSIGIYLILASVYACLFNRIGVLCQTFRGILSTIFYAPSFFILFPAYSIAKFDQIPQKGNLSPALRDSWKFIKFQHILKYLLWNIIIGSILVTLSSTFPPRFFITLCLSTLLCLLTILQSLTACLNLISYKCRTSIKPHIKTDGQSRIDNLLAIYRPFIMSAIEDHLDRIKLEYVNNQNLQSLFQASRTGNMMYQSRIRQALLDRKKSTCASKIHGFRSNTANSKYLSSPDSSRLPPEKLQSVDRSALALARIRPPSNSISRTVPLQDPKHPLNSTPSENPSLSLIKLSQIRQNPQQDLKTSPQKDNYLHYNAHASALPMDSKDDIPLRIERQTINVQQITRSKGPNSEIKLEKKQG